MHDFQQSLQKEEEYNNLTIEVLGDYFAASTVTRLQSGNVPSQHVGHDYGVVLPTGQYLTIDAKCDLYTTGRICLEVWSNAENRRQGWAYSGQLLASHIAYVLPNDKRAYILPYPQLTRFIHANYSQLLAMCQAGENDCRIIKAQNKTYTTSSFGLSYAIVEYYFGQTALHTW